MILSKKNGVTLIESLLGLSVIGALTTSYITLTSDERDEVKYNLLAEDLSTIITAIDTRLAIDGYNTNHWNTLSWNDKDIGKELLSKQLRSKHLKECKGEWEPLIEEEKEAELVSCDLWKNKIPLGLKASADITEDLHGFVDRFNLVVFYEEEDDFIDNYYLLKNTLRVLRGKANKESSGNHFYEFVALDDPNTPLSIVDCIDITNKCALKASFSRSGLNESVRIDGQNSVFNEKITFIEDQLNEPLKCVRWKKDNADIWSKTLVNEDECGIGIYKETGYPGIVEVNTTTGTFENILIDKECTVFEWDGNNVVDSTKTSPCGISQDSTEVYQIVDNIHANNGYYKNFYATDMNGEQSNINNIVTDNISADSIMISNDLDVKGMATINKLEVVNQTNLNNADIDRLSVSKESYFGTNLTFKSDLEVNQNIDVSNLMTGVDIITNHTTVNIELEALNEVKTDKYLLLTQVQSEGGSCSSNGSLAKTSNGNALNCINGKWDKMGSKTIPMGSISIWAGNGTPPSGWLECNGNTIPSSYGLLKSFLGSSKTPDLRGIFLRGLDEGTGRDDLCYNGDSTMNYYCMLSLNSLGLNKTTRTLGTFQMDANKKHRHSETHYTGTHSARGGSGLANNSLTTVQTGAAGGAEMVPKNVSLKYIIKAN